MNDIISSSTQSHIMNITASYTTSGKKASIKTPAMIHVVINVNNEHYHKMNLIYSKRDGWYCGSKIDEILFKQFVCTSVDISEKLTQKYINTLFRYFNVMSKETNSFHPRKWEFLNK